MPLNIPSTSVRSKYLKTLAVGTVYKDPKSGYNYEVVEKKLNSSLVKVSIPVLCQIFNPIYIKCYVLLMTVKMKSMIFLSNLHR